MKATITISIILLSVLFNSAQAQRWLWANSGGSGARATAVCKDQNGNSYVIGQVFAPSASFQGINITVNGFNDIFLAKYNPDGAMVWVKSFGGSYNNTLSDVRTEDARAVAYSAAANAVYISGNYIGTCNLGSVILTATGDVGNYNYQNFIAKFDVNGNCLWAKNTGNEGNALMNLTVSEDGKIFTCGGTSGTAAFDSFTLSNGTYIARYDDNGICQWLKKTSNDPNIGGSASIIKIFENDIFMIGTHIQSQKMFVARLSPEGNVKWLHKYSELYLKTGHEFNIDKDGNSYFSIRGKYVLIDNDTIFSANIFQFFLLKYDSNGNFKWEKHSNATVSAEIHSSFCDVNGNVYVTGQFSGIASFGNYSVSGRSDYMNFFLARYDSSGNCLGVQHGEAAEGNDLYVDANGSCVMVGGFSGSVSFGSITLTQQPNEQNNTSAAFIAKIDEVLTTGVKELDKKTAASNALLIYANPSAGKCSIKIPEDFKNEKDLTLYIYDNTGKLLHQFEIANGFENFKLNLDHEAKGIYNAVLSNRNKSYKGNIVLVE